MARRTRTRHLLGVVGITALATSAALVSAPSPDAQAAAEAAASSVTVTPDPSYKQDKFEGWGTSLVWFANATGDYPPAVREKLAKLLFGDDGLALNIARYNIGGGNAPDVKDYLRAGGAVEGWWKAPAGTTRDGHRLVERRRRGRLEPEGGQDPALVGGPHQEGHHPLGDVQQLAALVHDGERLRLRWLQRHHRPAEGRFGRRLRRLHGGGDEASGEGRGHQGRHRRPVQRAQHQLLEHPSGRGRPARRRPSGGRPHRSRAPGEGPRRSCPRAEEGQGQVRDLGDGRDQPVHLRDQLELLLARLQGPRRPAERPHLRHRAAHHRARPRQGGRQAAVDERGRGRLGRRAELHGHASGSRPRPADRQRPA